MDLPLNSFHPIFHLRAILSQDLKCTEGTSSDGVKVKCLVCSWYVREHSWPQHASSHVHNSKHRKQMAFLDSVQDNLLRREKLPPLKLRVARLPGKDWRSHMNEILLDYMSNDKVTLKQVEAVLKRYESKVEVGVVLELALWKISCQLSASPKEQFRDMLDAVVWINNGGWKQVKQSVRQSASSNNAIGLILPRVMEYLDL